MPSRPHQEDTEGRKRGTLRRVVLTAESLLERRPATYEVADRRPLAALAALVRFSDQPQWLALEWTDGAPSAMYVTPAREALLTALLDAAQVRLPWQQAVLCLMSPLRPQHVGLERRQHLDGRSRCFLSTPSRAMSF